MDAERGEELGSLTGEQVQYTFTGALSKAIKMMKLQLYTHISTRFHISITYQIYCVKNQKESRKSLQKHFCVLFVHKHIYKKIIKHAWN